MALYTARKSFGAVTSSWGPYGSCFEALAGLIKVMHADAWWYQSKLNAGLANTEKTEKIIDDLVSAIIELETGHFVKVQRPGFSYGVYTLTVF